MVCAPLRFAPLFLSYLSTRNSHPHTHTPWRQTPDRNNESLSKRNWDAHVIKWRKDLHQWDVPAGAAAAGGGSAEGSVAEGSAAPAQQEGGQ